MSNQSGKRPRRWRWQKRIYGVIAICLVLTAVARIWWGYHAESKLREILDRITARGEPIEWADLAPPAIPDNQNAVLLYKKALKIPLLSVPIPEEFRPYRAFRPLSDSSSPSGEEEERAGVEVEDPEWYRLYRLRTMLEDLATYPDFRGKHRSEFEQIMTEAKEALLVCRQARQLTSYDWGLDFVVSGYDCDFPDAQSLKNLSRLMCVAALHKHESGTDAEALEYLNDALALADAIDTSPPLVCHLIAIALDYEAISVLESIAPRLRNGTKPGAVSTAKVRGLIEYLLDANNRTQGLVRAYIGERNTAYDQCERFRRATGYNRKLWIGGLKRSGVSLVSSRRWTPPTRKGYATWNSLRRPTSRYNCKLATY